MSVMTLLNLNAVCYTHDVPDDVIRIIIEYVKTHTLKNKFNFKFDRAQLSMISDDIIYGVGILHTTYQGPYVIMDSWNLPGFTTRHGGDVAVEGQITRDLDWKACLDQDLVLTITDYYETQGEQYGAEGLGLRGGHGF